MKIWLNFNCKFKKLQSTGISKLYVQISPCVTTEPNCRTSALWAWPTRDTKQSLGSCDCTLITAEIQVGSAGAEAASATCQAWGSTKEAEHSLICRDKACRLNMLPLLATKFTRTISSSTEAKGSQTLPMLSIFPASSQVWKSAGSAASRNDFSLKHRFS